MELNLTSINRITFDINKWNYTLTSIIEIALMSINRITLTSIIEITLMSINGFTLTSIIEIT